MNSFPNNFLLFSHNFYPDSTTFIVSNVSFMLKLILWANSLQIYYVFKFYFGAIGTKF